MTQSTGITGIRTCERPNQGAKVGPILVMPRVKGATQHKNGKFFKKLFCHDTWQLSVKHVWYFVLFIDVISKPTPFYFIKKN
jgi:hypothetical protein